MSHDDVLCGQQANVSLRQETALISPHWSALSVARQVMTAVSALAALATLAGGVSLTVVLLFGPVDSPEGLRRGDYVLYAVGLVWPVTMAVFWVLGSCTLIATRHGHASVRLALLCAVSCAGPLVLYEYFFHADGALDAGGIRALSILLVGEILALHGVILWVLWSRTVPHLRRARAPQHTV